MLEIIVRDNGGLTVASYFRDGRLHQVIGYQSWAELIQKWTTIWSIDISRVVRVAAASSGARHSFGLPRP